MANKIKIGIDARLFSQTGVGTYIRNLLYYLPLLSTERYVFYIYLVKKDWNKVRFYRKNFIKREANFYWHGFSEQVGFLQTLKKDNLNLMYFSYFSYPVFYNRPFFSTIHDLTPLYFKTGRSSTKNFLLFKIKHFIFQLVLKNQVAKSLAIITPTQFVKDELIKIYGSKYQDKIFPLYEGVNYQLLKEKENTQLKRIFKSPFFVYIGNCYPHKNLERLIKAYWQSKNVFPKLVLVGPNDFFKKRIVKLIKHLKLEDKILFYTPHSSSDLVFFYKNALALVNPSLSEGFGLPLVEASYFNCPVIASKIAVFQEIMGNQYIAFDPLNIADINEKINEFLMKKPKFNFDLIKKKYSFKKMTKAWLNIVNSLVGNDN